MLCITRYILFLIVELYYNELPCVKLQGINTNGMFFRFIRKTFIKMAKKNKKKAELLWGVLVIIILVIWLYRDKLPPLASSLSGAFSGEAYRKVGIDGKLVFTEAFTNPGCQKKPDLYSQQIHTVKTFAGLIFSGCGNYGLNTGPIIIYSYNPTTQKLNLEYTMNTEDISRFVTIGKKLYVPAIDPHEPDVVDFAYRYVNSPVWTGLSPVGFAHVFDLATTTGKDLWLVGGSYNASALAVRSFDGGKTFDPAARLELPPLPTGYSFTRFYFAGVLNSKLYLQATDYPYAYVFDGTKWQETSANLQPLRNLPPGQFWDFGARPTEFNGHLIYLASTIGWPSRLYDFDGSKTVKSVFDQTSQYYDKSIDLQVYNGTLYVLVTGPSQAILATNDLKNWTTVTTIPNTINPKSFDILNGTFYVGAADSKIYQARFITK